jgi:hypothetical protein
MFHEVQNPAYGLLRLPAEPIADIFSFPANIPLSLKVFVLRLQIFTTIHKVMD